MKASKVKSSNLLSWKVSVCNIFLTESYDNRFGAGGGLSVRF